MVMYHAVPLLNIDVVVRAGCACSMVVDPLLEIDVAIGMVFLVLL